MQASPFPRIAIIIVVLCGLFLSNIPNVAAIDNRCFTKSECKEARTKLGVRDENDASDEAGQGFYQSSETAAACGGKTKVATDGKPGEEIGFCLPAGQTLTQIGFGGKQNFNHLGEFIQFIYQYGFIIATILAVLVIIVAGLQWTISGGNTATIQSAQTRIKGAFIGLIIIALSYTILQTVNPRTVNLRLPQIWMINPAELAPRYCNQTEDKLSFFTNQDEQLDAKERERRLRETKYIAQKERPSVCGDRYLVEGSGNLTCRGTLCEQKGNQRYICAPQQKDFQKDSCYRGDMVATVQNLGFSLAPDFATEVWDTPPIDEGETEIWGLCIGGKMFEVPSTDRTESHASIYTVTITFDDLGAPRKLGIENCGSAEGIKGFFWRFEMDENNDPDDENHYIGRGGKDLGDEAAFNRTKFSEKIKPFLYTLEEIEGAKLNGEIVNVDNILDIDAVNPISGLSGDDLRKKVYADIGF